MSAKGTSESKLYISPKELSERWQCSRSSVDRIARRIGLTRLCLGVGKNGLVRFVLKEIEAFEASRTLKSRSGLTSV